MGYNKPEIPKGGIMQVRSQRQGGTIWKILFKY